MFVIDALNEIVDDHAGVVRVNVSSGRLCALIVFETIAAIKEFAYIAADVLLQNKLPSRVVVHVIPNVDNHFV